MVTLPDSSLWIDFTRPRSPRWLKRFIAPYILDPTAHLAEPVIFEVLRHASAVESRQINQYFQTLPMLTTPETLWSTAADLGQACRRKSITASSLDLLIATVAMHHAAQVVTFDQDFQQIASVSNLHVKLLQRPTP